MVSKHPFRTHVVMVKRVANVTGKAVHLKGDNSDASTDSASLGAVPMNKLVGKVVLCVTERGLSRPAATLRSCTPPPRQRQAEP